MDNMDDHGAYVGAPAVAQRVFGELLQGGQQRPLEVSQLQRQAETLAEGGGGLARGVEGW